MAVNTPPSAEFSTTKAPDGTTQKCAYQGRKVVSLRWETPLAWCSERTTIAGTTANYPDGETIAISLTDRANPADQIGTLSAQVAGNAFRAYWGVLDILPTRKPGSGYVIRKEIDGKADNARTPLAQSVGFIANFTKSSQVGGSVGYDRTEPAIAATATEAAVPATKKTVYVITGYSLELSNYLLTLHGDLNYVRGWGKEIVQLGKTPPPNGFKLFGDTYHWGRFVEKTGSWEYWDGAPATPQWQPAPTGWTPGQDNHFSLAFYNDGKKWVCRNDDTLTWPGGLTDWPKSEYEGPGNTRDEKLKVWKSEIEKAWTGKFDLKRVECKSSLTECCRYKTRCVANFNELEALAAGALILTYENVRSDSTMWSLGDDRDTYLAPHEFGHLLGAPDEYEKAGTTQLGVKDDDGLSDGVDKNSLMAGGGPVKKRHYKGILLAMSLCANSVSGKDYTYMAVPPDATLALDPAIPKLQDPGPSPPIQQAIEPDPAKDWNVAAILGGLAAGAAAGAALGYLAGNKDPWLTVGAGALGALAGAGLGSLF